MDQKELYDAITMIAENDGDNYRAKDAEKAINQAIRFYVRAKMQELTNDLNDMRPALVADLAKNWKE